MFDGHRRGGGGVSPAPPMRRSSMANSAQSLQFRKTVVAKRSELCMHFIAKSGCALGSLCPYRHVGGARATQSVAVTTSDGEEDDENEAGADDNNSNGDAKTQAGAGATAVASVMRSPVYASALCPRAAARTLWFWAELPSVTGADRFPRWQPFCAEWRDLLEAMYESTAAAQRHRGSDGHRLLQQHGEFWIDLQRMVLRRKDDDGSRRPIQRVHLTPSPTWLLKDVSTRSGSTVDVAIDPSTTASSAQHSAAEVVDAVAASHLEYHYCQGERNIVTIAINQRIMRVNLLTMTACEVRARRSTLIHRGTATAKLRGAVSAAITSVRMGGHATRATDVGEAMPDPHPPPVRSTLVTIPQAPLSPPLGNKAGASPRPEDHGTTAPARTFVLLRRPVTVQMGCPPADPYNRQDLRVGITVESLHSGKPIEVLEGNRAQAASSTNATRYFVEPARIDVQSLTEDALPPDVCETGGAGCHWVSGHHLWATKHRCPLGRAAQCYLCEWQAAPTPTSIAVGAAADGDCSRRQRIKMAPHVGLLAERGEAHRALMVHDANGDNKTQQQQQLQQATAGSELTAVAAWRRHQVISRWFRSEWDTHHRNSSLSMSSLLAGDLPPSSHSVSMQQPHRMPSLGGDQTADAHVVLHRVDTRPGSHEWGQLVSLLQNGVAVPLPKRRKSLLFEEKATSLSVPKITTASACSSGGTTPASSLSPAVAPAQDFASVVPNPNRRAVIRIRQVLMQQLPYGWASDDGKDDGDDDEASVDGRLHVQRVQHGLFYSRYLRARNELFNEWFVALSGGGGTSGGSQADTSRCTEAERSREEALFRYVPRRWLHDILYQEDDDDVGCPASGVSKATSSVAQQQQSLLHDRLQRGEDATGTFYRGCVHFYRDVASASQERLIPGVPYALLVVVAFPGTTVRLAASEATRLVAPPLAVPWHINDVNEEDQVRKYRAFQSVVCSDAEEGVDDIAAPQEGTSPSASAASLASTKDGRASPHAATAAPEKGKGQASPPTASATSADAVAKKVFLYDATQWCPMYIVAV